LWHGVLQTPREMKIEDRQSQGGFQEVDPTFFPLLRTRMAFRSPFSATINALLPEASSSKRAEQPKAQSLATPRQKTKKLGPEIGSAASHSKFNILSGVRRRPPGAAKTELVLRPFFCTVNDNFCHLDCFRLCMIKEY
jgi:hypothetical protein